MDPDISRMSARVDLNLGGGYALPLPIQTSRLISTLGLFQDPDDVETLLAGLKRLRELMSKAAFGKHRAPEVYPGPEVSSDEALRQHIKDRGATAYHPVGTLRMGEGTAPVTPRLAVAGVTDLWVADASVMPSVTSCKYKRALDDDRLSGGKIHK
jgi:choline dehydrogenase-like flavoprotein